ncbi:hypothetical protein FKP32DRAFT_1586273 [Trametes sanguinea]|nr:hypothetical protein FKP32DRAFT_1586273 [Trametes sanguinea]
MTPWHVVFVIRLLPLALCLRSATARVLRTAPYPGETSSGARSVNRLRPVDNVAHVVTLYAVLCSNASPSPRPRPPVARMSRLESTTSGGV